MTSKSENMGKIILDLCGGTGAWSKPYVEAGYDVRLVTLPEFDVTTYQPPADVYGILAAPPCTEFSVAKNHKIERDIEAGMVTVNACLRIIKEANPSFYAIENPAGVLRSILGQHQYSFQPWFFGDGWTKRTLLWGNFNHPKREFYEWGKVPKIPGLYIRPGRGTPSIAFQHRGHAQFIRAFDWLPQEAFATDAGFRAITPPGFAKAFFEANP